MRRFRFGCNVRTIRSRDALRRTCGDAERRGYDVLLIPDHLGRNRPAPCPMIVAIAEATDRVRVGPFVLNVGFWNPSMLAREMATTDQLTDGRLELGLGVTRGLLGVDDRLHDQVELPVVELLGVVVDLVWVAAMAPCQLAWRHLPPWARSCTSLAHGFVPPRGRQCPFGPMQAPVGPGSQGPAVLVDGTLLISGQIERVTDFEKGFPIHYRRCGHDWEPDFMFWDDQCVMVNVRGGGLLVISAYSHSGVINTLLNARRLGGEDRILAFSGGWHLSPASMWPVLDRTVGCRSGTIRGVSFCR